MFPSTGDLEKTAYILVLLRTRQRLALGCLVEPLILEMPHLRAVLLLLTKVLLIEWAVWLLEHFQIGLVISLEFVTVLVLLGQLLWLHLLLLLLPVVRLFAIVELSRLEVVRPCRVSCVLFLLCLAETIRLIALSFIFLGNVLLSHALGALRSVCRVAQRFTLFNLLVDQGQWVLEVRRLLLIKRGHSKLLMGQRSMLPSRWSVSIMGVVPEILVVDVSEGRQDRVYPSEEPFVFYK